MPEPRRRYGPSEPEHELEDDQIEPPIQINNNLSNIVVVDNVPIAPNDKVDKLKTVLVKIFTTMAGPVQQLHLPQDDKLATKGFAFIEFANEDLAKTAIEKIDKFPLDKQHTLKVSSFEEFTKVVKVSDTYTPPELPPYEPRENLRSWLLDGRDQYAARYGDFTEVLWNDIKNGEGPETVVKRENWTEAYVTWSPQGTYLATLHNEGVAIWGGSSWTKLGKFPHPGVKLIEFSPCEKYLVTASPQFQEIDNPKDPQCIIVWDIRSGAKLRGYLGDVGGNTSAKWPLYKWSFDDKYLARMSEDTISIYEVPTMDLLEKKSVKIAGLKDFAWSPTENIISYFVPEGNNKPATVVLLEIPSRKEKRQKNLFNVTDCKMHWQSSGDYLCVKVDRHTKTKKTTYTDFELFRIREKDIPIEHLEMKDAITAFAWEPKGYKFAIIHGEAPKPNVSFYTMEGKEFKHIKTLEKRSANQLHWSPQGSFIILAGMGSLNGTFEFYNAGDMESMGTEEHYNATSIEWDPTGRFVASVVSFWRYQVETGYNLYSFQGKVLKHFLKDKFYQLLWRPRPTPLLTPERLQYIKKNIREYAKELTNEDRIKDDLERSKKRAKRQALRNEFDALMKQREKEYEAITKERKELGYDEEEDERDFEFKEQWVEEIEEVQEIVIQED